MSHQIVKDHNLEALKTAASWPGADRATLVTLATVLAATGAEHDGLAYFGALAASQPDQVLPLALAGYFQVLAGEDIPAGLAKLDDAAGRDLGLAQYYRGLALAALPAEAGHAEQALADLEFVLAVRDQFPGGWADPADGYHFSSPKITEVAPGVRLAQGHDFADFAFVSTGSGVVAI